MKEEFRNGPRKRIRQNLGATKLSKLDLNTQKWHIGIAFQLSPQFRNLQRPDLIVQDWGSKRDPYYGKRDPKWVPNTHPPKSESHKTLKIGFKHAKMAQRNYVSTQSATPKFATSRLNSLRLRLQNGTLLWRKGSEMGPENVSDKIPNPQTP